MDADKPAYGRVARTIHWVTAALVLGLIPAGIVMANMKSGPVQDVLYHLHRSTGFVVLVLMVIRLIYRVSHPPPPLPADIPALQRHGAEAMHWLLYGLLILQPLVGWVATSAYGAPVVFFWLFDLPPIWPQGRPFSEQAFLVHQILGFVLAGLLMVHIGAALFHHFVRRDRVLMRMISG